MGLIKRNIHMDGCRHENKTISLDQDYNIPDMKPDAKMIIREQGDIVNLECRSMGEKFGIRGRCRSRFCIQRKKTDSLHA